MAQGRRRGFKSWFVEPYIQVRIGLWFLIINSTFCGLIFAVFSYFVLDVYQAVSMYFKINEVESIQVFAKYQWPLVLGGFLILAFIATTILVSARLTHSLYGPLVSIQRFLDDILNKRIPDPIQLRSNDQLQELATRLNQVRDLMIQENSPMESRQDLIKIQNYLNHLQDGKEAILEGSDRDFMLADIGKKIRRLASPKAQ